jgi:L-rhamnonate dehydratase
MRSRRAFLKQVLAYSAAGGLGSSAWGSAREPRRTGAEEGLSADPTAPVGSTLKIVSVDAYPVHMWKPAPGDWKPPRFSSDDDPGRWRFIGPFAQLPSSIVVVLKTNEGITGFGLGAGGRVAVDIIRGHLRYLLEGANPLGVERLWEQMYSSGLFYGRRGVFVMALSGVDNALWDIAGKHAGKPVYRMIGGRPKEKAEVYLTGDAVDRGLEAGVKNFKLMTITRRPADREAMGPIVKRVMDVRERIGLDRRLMIDCSASWRDVEYTVEMARRLEAARLYFIEEALSPDDVLGYAELVRRVDSTSIASGEHEYTHHGFEMLLHHDAVEILQPDVTWSGGLTAALRISAMAQEWGLRIIPHRGGSLYGLPIPLTREHCPLAESFGVPGMSTELMMAMTPRFEGGDYLASERPGFGTGLTEELVLEHVNREYESTG